VLIPKKDRIQKIDIQILDVLKEKEARKEWNSFFAFIW
jgi:hypothetical protein